MSSSPAILLLGALRAEVSPFEMLLDDPERIPGPSGTLVQGRHNGRRVVVGRTGVGPERAARRTASLLTLANPVGHLLFVGMAGGLDPSLEPGDVVLIEGSDGPLLSAAETALERENLRVRRGVSATVSAPIKTAAAKSRLFRQHGAIAVEMENAPVLHAARQAGVPALLIRVILDEATFDLPSVEGVVDPSEGSITARGVLEMLGCPADLVRLPALGIRFRKARRAICQLAPLLLKLLASGEQSESGREEPADR